MKVRFSRLPLAFVMSAATLTSASAADFGNGVGAGGIKDMSRTSGVPVPAPVPIPVSNGGWYLRLDAGVGIINEPDIAESGWAYGTFDGPGPITGPGDARSSNSSWFSSDFATFTTWGGGVGYDFGRGWRLDFTGEKRSKGDIAGGVTDSWDSYGYDCCGTYAVIDNNGDGAPDSKTTITVKENAKLDGTIWMANLYYDLAKRGHFVPYVGAGLGVAWNVFSRTHIDTVTTCDLTTSPACQQQFAQSSTTASSSIDRATLAAALMAGVSYDLSDISTLDIGYRYLFVGGTDVQTDIGKYHSKLSVGDQNIHQVRAGVRFNFN